MRTRLEIPVRRPVNIGFTLTEHGTETHTGTPCAWYDIDEFGDVTVWTGHFTITLIPEAAPYIRTALDGYIEHWGEVDFPDLADGPRAWRVAASAFFDFLVVDVGDPLHKNLLDLIAHPHLLDGWIGEFVVEYATEIDRLDEVLAEMFNGHREWKW